MFNLNLKKEVTFTITPPMREEGYVKITYAFTKDQEPVTIADHFDFKDGKFVFKWDDEAHQDFAILMGLLEGGMEALESHLNFCYQSGKIEPLILKTNPKFLNEEDREYLTDEQLKEESSSGVLRSIWKWYYNGKILKEWLKDWKEFEITKDQFSSHSVNKRNDLKFAQQVLKQNFTIEYSVFIQYENGNSHFYVVKIPQSEKQFVALYVEGGDSFGNWIVT